MNDPSLKEAIMLTVYSQCASPFNGSVKQTNCKVGFRLSDTVYQLSASTCAFMAGGAGTAKTGNEYVFVAVVVVVIVYWMVALANTSNLSGPVVRTLRGGERLPKMFCLVESSIVCGSSLQRGYKGPAEGSRRWA